MDMIPVEVFRVLKRMDPKLLFKIAPPLMTWPICQAQGPGGFGCTMPRNHDGCHIAHGVPYTHVIQIWCNDGSINESDVVGV